jgi:serine/threonine-protein kinase Chk1
MTIVTKDRRGAQLVIKCSFITIDGRLMVDFRMSRGCGLEFKRHYRVIKTNCGSIVDKAPVLWPQVLPLKALPGVVSEEDPKMTGEEDKKEDEKENSDKEQN